MAKWKRPRIVEVEWDDSMTDGRWQSADYFKQCGPARCSSTGYVIERTAAKIVLVQSMSDTTGNATDSISIPAGCIRQVRVLKKGK